MGQFFPDRDDRDKGGTTDRSANSEEDGARRPTLYLVLDPDQDPSRPSEVTMLVGTKEELCSQTGGGDELEMGVGPWLPTKVSTALDRGSAITKGRAQTVPKGDVSD